MDHETVHDDGLAPVVPPTRVEVTRLRSAALFLEFRDEEAPSASRDAPCSPVESISSGRESVMPESRRTPR